jgi:pre-mRNA-processing factor 39
MQDCFADRFGRLFERGASSVGLDFLAHPFWDKYLEYEERQEAPERIGAILQRIVNIPMHQYSRYYERLRIMVNTRPVAEVAPAATIARLRSDVAAESMSYGGAQRSEDDIETAVRAKVEQMYYENFQRVQSETNRRWTFEQEIKRPYFHVTELEHPQLSNWRKYLDFEEAEGDYARILFLYERCLVTCALYDEFWFRYVRWMSSQKDKTEEVRNIYLRASALFVPISRPGIRLQFAYFEESCGRVDMAHDIHAALLMVLPDCIEVTVSWAHLQRRQSGLDSAIGVYKAQIDNPQVDIYTKAALVTEWAFLLWRVKGSVDEARAVFTKNLQWYADSRIFWDKWIEFELGQPTNADLEPEHSERVKTVFDQLRTKSRLSVLVKKELTRSYFLYLQQRGGKDAMKQFLLLDRETFG